MSQVDYLHFFNNIIWNLIQLFLMYVIISVIFVQSFYKVFRLRLFIYKNFSSFVINQDYFINKICNLLKKIYLIKRNTFKVYKFKNINQKEIN